MWYEFATGEGGGDIISLYAYIKGLSLYEAAKKLLGKNCYNHKTKNITHNPPKVPKVYAKGLAGKVWKEYQPAPGTPVEKYLRYRGYSCNIPETMKYHANLKHSGTSAFYPAMVSAVTIWPDRVPIAIHRTYLEPNGISKADIESNKMISGSAIGGAVRLAPLGKKLIITEGIETGLSVYLATGITTWASLSASFMKAIILPDPEQLSEVIIAADNDKTGISTAYKLADSLLKTGYIIRIAKPGQKSRDFNDILRG